MTKEHIEKILKAFQQGDLSLEAASDVLRKIPYEEMGFAKIDHHRTMRQGFPEAVFCEGKTVEQVAQIIERMNQGERNILATRASAEMFEAVHRLVPEADYHPVSRVIAIRKEKLKVDKRRFILVMSAGTSDLPVVEEAAITAELMGNHVETIHDVGVAGIHRLFAQHDRIQAANVLVVVAGMEGALASVVGGLVAKPVVAVPTSVGYGANFKGLAALLGMLNSCAAGVAVVNIDNGFGAGRLASIINHMR
jgi:NCAIR mutase (PurE)-related protein